jgi:hypothetical protein
MVSPVQIRIEELQTLHALTSWIVGNYGNSEHTDPPVSISPSNNTVYPEGQRSSRVLDGQLMLYHGAPVSIVAAILLLWEHTASLDMILVRPSPNILR